MATPSTAAIKWFLAHGVTVETLGRYWAVGAARVCFEPAGCYTPVVTGDFAFIFAAQTAAGVADLVAWQPATGRLATRLGVAGLLGQRFAEDARDSIAARPVRVWRSPLTWLRAGRDGVVVVDPEQAAYLLADLPLVPEDIEFRQSLMTLRVPPPRVILSASGKFAR
jgi:hypothetical protein